jgi:hypothetical protein
MVEAGNKAADYATIQKFSRVAGMDVEMSSIRERARAYAREGHLNKGVSGFRVSPEAIERFGLKEGQK